MDQHMPEQDGIEATLEIRRSGESGRRIPIIALTASALPEDRERCQHAGMDDFLAKPFNSSALKAAIACHPRAEQRGAEHRPSARRGSADEPREGAAAKSRLPAETSAARVA
jgi:CheY-like chemotaxis protein